jgi:hypothetical protein
MRTKETIEIARHVFPRLLASGSPLDIKIRATIMPTMGMKRDSA